MTSTAGSPRESSRELEPRADRFCTSYILYVRRRIHVCCLCRRYGKRELGREREGERDIEYAYHEYTTRAL